jgi:DNA repair protein RadC
LERYVPIRDWPSIQRPREKLIRDGPAALSDAELVALFLHTGTVGRSAVELAADLLVRFDGLSGIFSASLSEFSDLKGLGPAKFAQLHAVLEIARRTLGEALRTGPVLDSSRQLREYLMLELGTRPHEVFIGLFLDSQNRLLSAKELFRGTLLQTSIYPREVVKAALAANAASVVFAHNHPSGVARPSQADEIVTRTLQTALLLVDIAVVDHIVVAGHRTYSFAEAGLLG